MSIDKNFYKFLAVEGIVLTGAITYLKYQWYNDKERVPFHFYNDFKGWNQVDKLGHFYISYLESNVGYSLLKKFNLEKTVLHLKGRLEEVNLSNARLLYTNRVLNSTSLNERQKTKIVESISNADSVEEAKVIFETLQSAAGNSTRRKPKSLSEAISRPSSTLPRRRRENAQGETIVKDRFQRLAGLK